MEQNFQCPLKVWKGIGLIAACHLIRPPRCCLPHLGQSFLVVGYSRYSSKSRTTWNVGSNLPCARILCVSLFYLQHQSTKLQLSLGSICVEHTLWSDPSVLSNNSKYTMEWKLANQRKLNNQVTWSVEPIFTIFTIHQSCGRL